MDKRLGVTLKQSYFNRVTAMLYSSMIPPGSSDIIHRYLLRKTKSEEENRTWDGYYKHCCKVVETTAHIFECEKTREYLEKLSTNVGVQKVYDIKSLFGDHYLCSDHKKRNRIFAQGLRFNLVAYISNLLGSNNVKSNVLGEGMKEMLGIGGDPS